MMSRGEKALMWVSAVSVGIMWLFMALWLAALMAAMVGLVAGTMPSTIHIPRVGGRLIFVAFGMFMALGLVYLVTALSVRCPNCELKFLKNPRGLGPAGFSYNAQCPRLPGINPWAYQMGRFLCTGSMKCIGCGQEVCGASSQGAEADATPKGVPGRIETGKGNNMARVDRLGFGV